MSHNFMTPYFMVKNTALERTVVCKSTFHYYYNKFQYRYHLSFHVAGKDIRITSAILFHNTASKYNICATRY